MTREEGEASMVAMGGSVSGVTVAPATGTDVGVLEQASQVCDAAALRAGVRVRVLTELEEMAGVVSLFSDVWGRSANPPLTLEMLRALSKAGNYVGGALEQGRLVGACVGFFHAPSEDTLHSHIAGVAPDATGRSIGFALKLHQRAWALARGVGEVAWTYDPLVARNAWFNVVKLGAQPAEYLTNFYGPMQDAINGDDDTDRVLVRWPLATPRVAAACAGQGHGSDATQELARGAAAVLLADELGAPVVLDPHPGADTLLVRVPPDIQRLRASDPALARRWRVAVREVLGRLLDEGGRVEGVDRSGCYVVRRTS